MRRSDHPSGGFSSFDPKTFSLAKLIIIIAYHHKCDKMVIIVRDTNEQQLTCWIGLLPPCPHHLYYNSSHTLKHLPQCLDKLHLSLKSRLQTTPFMNTSCCGMMCWCPKCELCYSTSFFFQNQFL